MTFEEFVQRYDSVLRGYSFRFAGNREDAQDLYQDTVIKIYKNFDSWDQTKDAGNWVIQIMKRTWLDTIRARNRRVDTISFDFHAYNPAIQFEDKQAGQDEIIHYRIEIGEDLGKLTPKRQTIVNLMLDGKDVKVISSELHVTDQVVRANLCRIRRNYRTRKKEVESI